MLKLGDSSWRFMALPSLGISAGERVTSIMRLCIGVVLCSLVVGVSSDGWFSFFKEAVQGSSDLGRAYWHMQVASYPNSERYFHARGNYDAAQRGPGGVWAAKTISTFGKYLQGILNRFYYGRSNYGVENIQSNQKAEEWGRSGKDPSHFRPPGLPERY
ncbi:PREDICTED: serum amyloid A-4 protein isoform X1 [Chinchilla lanigera]|uniref:serum amyloid A-4 protein isoform X1 n=1 Tax=Chinchilla lanigera TaxID=34839 RepID=UPI0006990E5E|nr:PREDICTED: serum amyloid A-4 protein isoform X1 [Chinchilla lanigera]